MKHKKLFVAALATSLVLASSITSLAGEWKKDNIGWWWQDGGWYPTSTWMTINGKDYYFDSTGYMLHDTYQDGFWLNSDGDRQITDIGLEVAPYKAELDKVISANLEVFNGENVGFEILNNYGVEWLDCGSYYKIKNIKLVDTTHSYEYKNLGYLDEIFIRKDGLYIFDNEVMTLNQWITDINLTPRYQLHFDEKGYVIGFRDGNIS